MIIDGRSLSAGAVVETDLCIVGAGAAGITLAREFADKSIRVALIESGGFSAEPGTRALKIGRVAGLRYPRLVDARLRYFGGTTNHWTGRCRPLEESDFATRPWVSRSGWPFDRAHLEPFYARAAQICQLPSQSWDRASLEASLGTQALPLDSAQVESNVFYMSPPTRFGTVYRERLERAKNIDVYLNANLTDFETDEGATSVKTARLKCLEGNAFEIHARSFVLACGGLENPRLLLLSNRSNPAGLGNDHDRVGRYFMEHPMNTPGVWVPSRAGIDVRFYQLWPKRKPLARFPSMGWLSLSSQATRQEGIGNFMAAILPAPRPRAKPAAWRDGESGMGDEPQFVDAFARSVGLASAHMDIPSAAAWSGVRRAQASEPARRNYRLVTSIEMTPNPDSRVVLGSAVDALGQRQIELHAVVSEFDRRTVARGTAVLARELAKAGLGRVWLPYDETQPWKLLTPRFHHMGTTRMHENPRQGVVDSNCRVHGVANLFVAGSSVFATGGAGVPTLTIVALAVRLADHLKARFAGNST